MEYLCPHGDIVRGWSSTPAKNIDAVRVRFGCRSAVDQVPGDVGGGRRPQRGAAVRGVGATAADCPVLDHRRQRHDRHRGSSGQRVLDIGHGRSSVVVAPCRNCLPILL